VKRLNPVASEARKRIQQGDADRPTLAHAVTISEDYLRGEPFVMYLGDNLLKQGAKPLIQIFEETRCDCVVDAAKVKDPVDTASSPSTRMELSAGSSRSPRTSSRQTSSSSRSSNHTITGKSRRPPP
jgi:hypothetical protein